MKRKTNIQLINEIMNSGAVPQIFVMDAIDKLSRAVIESKKKDYGENLIPYESWVKVAKFINKKMEETYK